MKRHLSTHWLQSDLAILLQVGKCEKLAEIDSNVSAPASSMLLTQMNGFTSYYWQDFWADYLLVASIVKWIIILTRCGPSDTGAQ
jgi:hypothetical protein